MRRRTERLWILIAMLLSSGSAAAGLFKDSVHYDVRIVDEQSRPIPWATLWVMGPTVNRPDIESADLARLVRRYAADADFVFSTNLHRQLWVIRADGAGRARFAQQDSEVHGLKRVQVSAAGLKRGFVPAQVDDDAPNNSRRKLVLRLKADPASDVDARMEQLDRVRALSDPDSETGDPGGGDRKTRLQRYDSQLRALAAELEQDGRRDDAAAIYYNLAWLPAVDFSREESGALVVRGYTNGFDDRNPRRVADRKRAWQLARNHPMLEYEAMLDSYLARGMRDMTLVENSRMRQDYLADTERLMRLHGERLWPSSFLLLELVYTTEGQFEAACRALRAFHEFDPSYFPNSSWTRLTAYYHYGVKRRGGPADAACPLPGVPVYSGN